MSVVDVRRTQSQSTQVIHHHEYQRCAESKDPDVLTEIYDEGTYIAIWKRKLPLSLRKTVAEFIDENPTYRTSAAVTPNSVRATLNESFGNLPYTDLCEDIAELVGMFCMLFDLKRAGVRLGVLDNAMCPKFHVDKITCRLITTYQGVATEWLPHELVDRSRLGHGSGGVADHKSGLFEHPVDIRQLNRGDVAIFKGDFREGSGGKGLVHRSPRMESSRRLLLTLDLMS